MLQTYADCCHPLAWLPGLVHRAKSFCEVDIAFPKGSALAIPRLDRSPPCVGQLYLANKQGLHFWGQLLGQLLGQLYLTNPQGLHF